MLLTGKCHCGNITLELQWTGDPPALPARACGCSFCTKHGAVWTSSPDAELQVLVRDPALVSQYHFGTETAAFHVCATCGAVPLVVCEMENRLYSVVNVNILENVDPMWLHRTATNFDAEDVESRLTRRKRTWIPKVHIANHSGA